MKHLKSSNKPFIIVVIIAALIFLTSVACFAEVKREGNTFKTEKVSTSDTPTKYKWADKEGNKYTIYITKNNACYVKRISKKSGKEYKYYLPKDIQAQIVKELNK
jgi:hypothetical protein